jgi:hypothetical protein
MITIRCKNCNTELTGHPNKTRCCGCENYTTIKGDTISAIDLSKVIIVSQDKPIQEKKTSYFTEEEHAFYENRKKRKVRKLDFEIR